jgi:hypothetical protein
MHEQMLNLVKFSGFLGIQEIIFDNPSRYENKANVRREIFYLRKS